MGPIQVVPPGLMGLLQLKQMGRLPGDLSETVAGVLELRDWYMTARRLDEIALFGSSLTRLIATGAGPMAFLQTASAVNAQVPNGQIWFVEEFSLVAPTAAAADVISIVPAIVNPQNSSKQIVGPQYQDAVSARNRVGFAAASRGFWAFPGDIFAVGVIDIATVGITVQGCIRATPCPL